MRPLTELRERMQNRIKSSVPAKSSGTQSSSSETIKHSPANTGGGSAICCDPTFTTAVAVVGTASAGFFAVCAVFCDDGCKKMFTRFDEELDSRSERFVPELLWSEKKIKKKFKRS